jgi:hypothetical protein
MNNKEIIVPAWLVWYSESDIHPIYLPYSPIYPEDYFRIDEIKVLKEIK